MKTKFSERRNKKVIILQKEQKIVKKKSNKVYDKKRRKIFYTKKKKTRNVILKELKILFHKILQEKIDRIKRKKSCYKKFV